MPPGAPAGYDPTYQIFGVIAVVVVVMLIRMARGNPARRVRVETMWIGPVIFLGMAGWMLHAFPPEPSATIYAILAAATVIGFGVGWLRGRMVRISLNVETHQLMSQISPWGMLILLGIMALRIGLRLLLTDHMADWHISATALTDGFLLFYVGMLMGRRVEILIRCLKILKGAAADKAAGKAVSEVVTEDHA